MLSQGQQQAQAAELREIHRAEENIRIEEEQKKDKEKEKAKKKKEEVTGNKYTRMGLRRGWVVMCSFFGFIIGVIWVDLFIIFGIILGKGVFPKLGDEWNDFMPMPESRRDKLGFYEVIILSFANLILFLLALLVVFVVIIVDRLLESGLFFLNPLS